MINIDAHSWPGHAVNKLGALHPLAPPSEFTASTEATLQSQTLWRVIRLPVLLLLLSMYNGAGTTAVGERTFYARRRGKKRAADDIDDLVVRDLGCAGEICSYSGFAKGGEEGEKKVLSASFPRTAWKRPERF